MAAVFSFYVGISCAQNVLFQLFDRGEYSRFEQVFSEEFDSGLDRQKWMTSFPWGRHLEGNTENDESQEYYSDGKNISFSNGIASFEARKEKICGICAPWLDSLAVLKNGLKNYRCFDYSAPLLYSVNDYGYGWYEVRFRQAGNARGLWPAFWLFGESNEIDVFENKGEKKNETHWDVHCKDGCKSSYGGWIKLDTDFSADFNTLAVNWEPGTIQWYFEGNNYKTVKQSFSSKMNMIVNMAVARTKDKEGFWVGPDATTKFPSSLEVDYIKYYKSIYIDHRVKNKKINDLLKLSFSDEKLHQQVKKRAGLKKKQRMLLSANYSVEKKQLTVTSYSDKNAAVYIYNSSQVLMQKVALKGTMELTGLPDETLYIVIQHGKYILADRLNERR